MADKHGSEVRIKNTGAKKGEIGKRKMDPPLQNNVCIKLNISMINVPKTLHHVVHEYLFIG